MKRSLFVAAACLTVSFCAAQSTEIGTGETGGYSLVWQDLFNDSQLDATQWNIEVNGDGGGNSELQYYRAENVSLGTEPVSGSNCLILTAKKENYLGKTATSGRINTGGKMSFKHGKVEAYIKFPYTANGLWPAFWLLGSDYATVSWPRCGEIDIVEMGNSTGINAGTQDRYFNGACHWGYYSGGGYPNYAKASTWSYSLQNSFHLFTLIWDENVVKMYVDLDIYPNSEPYYEMTINGTSSDTDPGNYFHKQFFVIFNMAVGGNFTQIWDINSISALASGEAKMYVDYVRMYQKGTADEEFAGIRSGIDTPKKETGFCIYPNPATDVVNLSKNAAKAILYAPTGQLLWEQQNVQSINLSACPAGCYKLQLTDENGQNVVNTIVKQ